MPEQLQKAINLVKRTGDRIIVFDNLRAEDAFVIMDLDCYEKMLDSQEEIRSLTEDELLDRINRDVALWRSESNQNSEDLSESLNNEFIGPFNSAQDENNTSKQAFPSVIQDDEDLYYYEDTLENLEQNIENNDSDNNDFSPEFEDNNKKNNWRIPSGIKEAADEVVEGDEVESL